MLTIMLAIMPSNIWRALTVIYSIQRSVHAYRSRNDQVATDYRLWLIKEVNRTRASLHQLITVACDRAEAEVDVLMPGFTHLQNAQTVRWSHWLLCHASAWQRDDQRMRDLLPRVAMLPLGSGALAGNPFGVDLAARCASQTCGGLRLSAHARSGNQVTSTTPSCMFRCD
jgi:argininosuccinate lyase